MRCGKICGHDVRERDVFEFIVHCTYALCVCDYGMERGRERGREGMKSIHRTRGAKIS